MEWVLFMNIRYLELINFKISVAFLINNLYFCHHFKGKENNFCWKYKNNQFMINERRLLLLLRTLLFFTSFFFHSSIAFRSGPFWFEILLFSVRGITNECFDTSYFMNLSYFYISSLLCDE